MKLYLISQTVNDDYDTYDSAVVAALSLSAAQKMLPNGRDPAQYGFDGWCSPEDVTVIYLGEAKARTKAGVVCSSFNAG